MQYYSKLSTLSCFIAFSSPVCSGHALWLHLSPNFLVQSLELGTDSVATFIPWEQGTGQHFKNTCIVVAFYCYIYILR